MRLRLLFVLSLLLVVSEFAAAQATIIGGYASTWPPSYGNYTAPPNMPLVVTPSVSLDSAPAPAVIIEGNEEAVVGAGNSTIENFSTSSRPLFAVPRWYGPSAAREVFVTPEEPAAEPGRSASRRDRAFQAGAASFQSTEGLASLAGLSKPGAKAARTITNDDVQRLNQDNDTVKHNGKTEKL